MPVAARSHPGVHAKRRVQRPSHDMRGIRFDSVPTTGTDVRFLAGATGQTLDVIFLPAARHDPRDAGEALHIQGAIGLTAPFGLSLTGHGLIRIILWYGCHQGAVAIHRKRIEILVRDQQIRAFARCNFADVGLT